MTSYTSHWRNEKRSVRTCQLLGSRRPQDARPHCISLLWFVKKPLWAKPTKTHWFDVFQFLPCAVIDFIFPGRHTLHCQHTWRTWATTRGKDRPWRHLSPVLEDKHRKRHLAKTAANLSDTLATVPFRTKLPIHVQRIHLKKSKSLGRLRWPRHCFRRNCRFARTLGHPAVLQMSRFLEIRHGVFKPPLQASSTKSSEAVLKKYRQLLVSTASYWPSFDMSDIETSKCFGNKSISILKSFYWRFGSLVEVDVLYGLFIYQWYRRWPVNHGPATTPTRLQLKPQAHPPACSYLQLVCPAKLQCVSSEKEFFGTTANRLWSGSWPPWAYASFASDASLCSEVQQLASARPAAPVFAFLKLSLAEVAKLSESCKTCTSFQSQSFVKTSCQHLWCLAFTCA